MLELGSTTLDGLGRRSRTLARVSLAGLTMACLVAAVLTRAPHGPLPFWIGVAAAVGVAVAPRWPRAAVALGLVDFALSGPSLALFVAAAVLPVRIPRRPVAWLVGAWALAVLAVRVGPAWSDADWWDATRATAIAVLTPGAVGLTVRTWFERERLSRELSVERLRRAELDRRHVEVTTRLRIAQRMHDGLGHRLSLLVLGLSGVDGLIGADDDRARSLLHEVQGTARSAMEELRDTIADSRGTAGRGQATGRAPATDERPGTDVDTVGPLRTTVERARRAGIDVVLTAPPTLWASPADRVLLERVLTEALTNVAKHAPKAHTEARLGPVPAGIELAVVNDPPRGPAPAPPVSGTGLRSLTAALDELGGSLRAGPTGTGGFRLEAVLPRRHPAADPEARP
jgi:signal transduction histidine kinase